jgi:hypothetical protein
MNILQEFWLNKAKIWTGILTLFKLPIVIEYFLLTHLIYINIWIWFWIFEYSFLVTLLHCLYFLFFLMNFSNVAIFTYETSYYLTECHILNMENCRDYFEHLLILILQKWFL